MTESFKDSALKRLRKIEGQVNGLRKMVDGNRPCLEMLQQLASVKAALDQVSVQFLSEHLQTCVLHTDPGSEQGCCEGLSEEEQTAEIRSALSLFLRHNKSSL